jgi:hypothetical protein
VTLVVTASIANLATNAFTLVIHGVGFSIIAANNTAAFTSSSGVVATGIRTTCTSLQRAWLFQIKASMSFLSRLGRVTLVAVLGSSTYGD